LGPAERLRESGEILKQLLNHPRFLAARNLMAYVALESEVETRPFLQESRRTGKRIYVPRIDPEKKQMALIEMMDLKDLKPGPYGILEPPFNEGLVGKPEDLDLVVVPGIGFDREGGRLGRGEGYFDRFLQETKRAYKIGLAFRCQVVERIPREANDVVVDEVLIA
jgi:5-formyltetrahydrofolate cyclo-ligase